MSHENPKKLLIFVGDQNK